MSIPTASRCRRMMAEMHMPAHIVAHSRQVARVALRLCDARNGRGQPLDRLLIQAAGLLHDITKARSFTTGEDHAASAEIYLAEEGFAEVGRIVAQHVKLDAFDPLAPVTAAEIVNYSDKRVLHDRIVPLDERMAYILVRYGENNPLRCRRIDRLWQESRVLEAKLFDGLDCGPETIDALATLAPGPW